MKAVVIGSGVAGLAAAIRLRCQGFDVHVFEANPYPGGKLSEFTLGAYRFDAGPSLFTLPYMVDELFQLADRNPRLYFNYNRMDICCQYFFDDGTRLTAYAERSKLVGEIKDKLNVDAALVESYLERSRETYESAGRIFLQNSLHKINTWLRWSVAKSMARIYRYGIFSSMHQVNQQRLKHPKLVQLFNRYATYNGSNPYRAPGILTSIPHLEFSIGTYLPVGGMHAITQAVYKLAVDLGVRFSFQQSVTQIVVKGNRVFALDVGGQTVLADLVVSNMDAYYTYRKLMPYVKAPERVLNQERSSSALIFYWGINRSFSQLDLHNIFFSGDYEKEFHHIFDLHSVYHDPTVYISITSKYVEGHAPAGRENWFVMVNVPANKGQDWDTIITKTRKNVLAKLSRELGTDIEPLIEEEDLLDPRSIDSKTSSYQGSLYGTSSNNKFAAFLRHKNFSSQFGNLFFCGGSVHPGGGIPLCLLSAKIVSELIARKFKP
ncbi:MAG: 1-hydroxycarotenoid 3,4-desaturase CrtD [Cytophagales bacterium]